VRDMEERGAMSWLALHASFHDMAPAVMIFPFDFTITLLFCIIDYLIPLILGHESLISDSFPYL
jgi:hypothetical protein